MEMQSPKKRNKTSIFRNLKGLTQEQAAKTLKTGKSNISNMESEKHSPSEPYQKLLNIAPNEFVFTVLPSEKILLKLNMLNFCIEKTEKDTTYRTFHKNFVHEELSDTEYESSPYPEIIGEFNGTDIYFFKSAFEIPELSIKSSDKLPVVPKLYYKDNALILYRKSFSEFKIARVSEHGTKLLSVTENEPHPDISKVDIIGEILIK